MNGVIAFHGDVLPFMNGAAMLKRDMGDPGFVSCYWRGKDLWTAARCLKDFEKLVLIGYSSGGEFIARLTYELNNICGAILYESPCRLKDGPAKKDFPVWSLWNESSPRNGSVLAQQSIQAWSDRNEFTLIENLGGKGHFRLFPPSHSWDKGVNGRMVWWVRYCLNR